MKVKEVKRIIEQREDRISDELAAQFDNLFHVLIVTIKRISQKQWGSGVTPARTPAHQACHIVASIANYITGDYDGCLHRFGVAADSLDEKIDTTQLPEPSDVARYVEETQQLVGNWLRGIGNAELLGPTHTPGYAQRGVTYLGYIIYILRHGTYHLGNLRAELKERGIRYGAFR